MDSKRKNVYITIFVITTIIASCAAVYFYLKSTNNKLVATDEDKEKVTNGIEEDKTVSKSKEEVQEKIVYKYARPEFDSSKCINSQEGNIYNQAIRDNFNNMICSLSYDKKKVNIQAQSWKYVIDMYNFMNISLPSNVKPNDRFYFDISNFSTEVSNVFILGMGQSIGDETLFFLMKDGTVEYMPIVDSIRNNSIKSYGKIKNVNDIVDIIQGDVGYVEGGGWASIFALKSDGSFYDLSPILRETGFYR